jgi:hypothetical protein
MKNNNLHIVSFNIPDSPDNGGGIDIYYKIKNLSNAGIKKMHRNKINELPLYLPISASMNL